MDDDKSGSEIDQNVHYLSEVTSIFDSTEEIQPCVDCGCTTRSIHDYASPILYATPSEILQTLNIDARTRFVTTVSDSGTIISDRDIGDLQRTVAVIKPSAMKFSDEIIKRIKKEGFTILQTRKIKLTPEQVSDFYSAQYGSEIYPRLVVYMSSAPVLVMCLAGIKAVAHWRKVLGPTIVRDAELYWPESLRAKYGKYDSVHNAIHGSSDLEASRREIHFFFPEMILEPLTPSEPKICEYLYGHVNYILSKGLTELCRVKPAEPIIYLAFWLLKNNSYQPQMPEDVLTAAT